MPQLYLFLASVLAIVIIVGRRHMLFRRFIRAKFSEKVASKVEEIQKERHKEVTDERFRESVLKEQAKKKYEVGPYKTALRKAEMAIAKKHWNEAKQCLIQALTQTKDESPVSLQLASVYLESGDFKRSESLYRKLLEADPDSAYLHECLGKIHLKRKRYKEAVYEYAESLRLDEKNDKNLAALGRLYQLLMRPSLAAECFRRAAELKPRETVYLFLLADSCREAEDYENALFTYERILTLEPYNEQARERAQDVRIRMNEFEKAIAH